MKQPTPLDEVVLSDNVLDRLDEDVLIAGATIKKFRDVTSDDLDAHHDYLHALAVLDEATAKVLSDTLHRDLPARFGADLTHALFAMQAGWEMFPPEHTPESILLRWAGLSDDLKDQYEAAIKANMADLKIARKWLQ